MPQIGGLKSISLVQFNDAITGSSIGWKSREREVISDLSDRKVGLRGVGFHQMMKIASGKTVKVDYFIPVLKAFVKLILHNPCLVWITADTA